MGVTYRLDRIHHQLEEPLWQSAIHACEVEGVLLTPKVAWCRDTWGSAFMTCKDGRTFRNGSTRIRVISNGIVGLAQEVLIALDLLS